GRSLEPALQASRPRRPAYCRAARRQSTVHRRDSPRTGSGLGVVHDGTDDDRLIVRGAHVCHQDRWIVPYPGSDHRRRQRHRQPARASPPEAAPAAGPTVPSRPLRARPADLRRSQLSSWVIANMAVLPGSVSGTQSSGTSNSKGRNTKPPPNSTRSPSRIRPLPGASTPRLPSSWITGLVPGGHNSPASSTSPVGRCRTNRHRLSGSYQRVPVRRASIPPSRSWMTIRGSSPETPGPARAQPTPAANETTSTAASTSRPLPRHPRLTTHLPDLEQHAGTGRQSTTCRAPLHLGVHRRTSTFIALGRLDAGVNWSRVKGAMYA